MKDPKTPENTHKDDYEEREEFRIQSLIQGFKKVFLKKNFEEDKDSNKKSGQNIEESKSIDSSIMNSTNKTRQVEVQSQNSKLDDDPVKYDIKNHQALEFLRNRKNDIIKIISVAVAIFLIIYGVNFSISDSSVQVSSNVLFGERAMFSALLVLIGFLILAGVFGRKLLEGTFLKTIYSELEILKEKNRVKRITK